MNEQELQLAFIQFLAQKTGAKSQQELEAIIQQMGEEGLKQAYSEFMQTMQQQQVRAAKFGAKLNYIKLLRGQCPDGYEVKYFKNGGGITEKKCVACLKKQEILEPTNAVEAFKCGRKTKKKENGGSVKMDKCGSKMNKKVKKAESGDELTSTLAPLLNGQGQVYRDVATSRFDGKEYPIMDVEMNDGSVYGVDFSYKNPYYNGYSMVGNKRINLTPQQTIIGMKYALQPASFSSDVPGVSKRKH